MRFLKLVHLASPMVWEPDRATMSLAERPLELKLEISLLRLEVGAGMLVFAADRLAVLASLLPNFTFQVGPPRVTTESREAIAKMSAHETTPGHTFSTADLILSTTSNPLADPLLGTAVFSPVKDDVSSSRIDPSHPLTKQSWKWRRRRDAPIRRSFEIADWTVDFTALKTLGQVFE
eukprot:TRINITY_DN8396_c0_g1_i1.p2 TRINITY_DN8396_c0_g1~~TRINITY_DN8396_c0_g1_i1.p2  ORF type:complete len:177 (+),score=22.35 TRINITY_DN8396_c0_g1_i1:670-1200(+)